MLSGSLYSNLTGWAWGKSWLPTHLHLSFKYYCGINPVRAVEYMKVRGQLSSLGFLHYGFPGLSGIYRCFFPLIHLTGLTMSLKGLLLSLEERKKSFKVLILLLLPLDYSSWHAYTMVPCVAAEQITEGYLVRRNPDDLYNLNFVFLQKTFLIRSSGALLWLSNYVLVCETHDNGLLV